MIIFFNKQTGEIVGTVGGRVHNEAQMGIHIGSHEENGKLVNNWVKIKDSEDWEPEGEQKEIFIELDKSPMKVYDYKVGVNDKGEFTNLIKKDAIV